VSQQVIEKLRTLLPQGRFARAVSLVAGGTAIAQLLGALVTPILTRLIPADAFGVLASYVATLVMLQTIVGLRYEMAIPLAKTDRDAVVMLLVTLTAVVACTVLTLLAAAALAIGAFRFELTEKLGVILWLLPVGVVLAGVYQALRYWGVRSRAYRDIAATTLAQGFGRSLTQLGSGIAHFGAIGLVVGEIVGQSAGIIRLARPALQRARPFLGGITLAELWAVARANKSFPLLTGPASFLNQAGRQVPTLLVASLYGAQVAGWYYVTQRLLGMPLQIIGNAMGQVFLGEAAHLAKEDPHKLERHFDRIARKLLLAGCVPALAIVAIGPWATELVLGNGWREAGVYLQWMALSFLLKFSFDGLINMAMVGRNDYALAWSILRLALACGALAASHQLDLSAAAAMGWLGAAFSVAYLLKLWMWKSAVRQLQRAAP
jgi:O-antigen/teichoic acid export membrane protein